MGVAASAPDDVLERASGWLEEKDVLCLRALSPRGRDVARLAIARFATSRPRGLKARRSSTSSFFSHPDARSSTSSGALAATPIAASL